MRLWYGYIFNIEALFRESRSSLCTLTTSQPCCKLSIANKIGNAMPYSVASLRNASKQVHPNKRESKQVSGYVSKSLLQYHGTTIFGRQWLKFLQGEAFHLLQRIFGVCEGLLCKWIHVIIKTTWRGKCRAGGHLSSRSDGNAKSHRRNQQYYLHGPVPLTHLLQLLAPVAVCLQLALHLL
jgi:hypothetical protein